MYPEDIGPGSRFFFFYSLRRSAEINPEAQDTLFSAERVLFGGPKALEEKTFQASILASIEEAIQFLENMAIFEANNERLVFEQRLQPLIDSNPKYTPFKDIYQNDKIDYPLLLIFINTLNEDIDEFKNLLYDLKESTTGFNKSAKKIIQGKEYDYTQIQKKRGTLTTEARVLTHEMGVKASSEIAEIGASLIRDITSQNKDIEVKGRELIEQNIINMITQGQNQIALNSNAKLGLTSMLMSKLREIASLDRETKGTQAKLKKLLQEIQESHEKEEEVTEKLKKYSIELLNQLNIVETRGAQIQRILNRSFTPVKLQNGRIIGLDAATRKKINSFLEKQGKKAIDLNQLVNQPGTLQEGEKRSKNILKREVNEQYTKRLQELLELQENSLDELIQELNQILRQSTQNIRKEQITIMTESRSANKIYGLLPVETIKGVALDALENGKNDASGFFLGKAFYESGIDPDMAEVLEYELGQFQKRQKPFLTELGEKNTKTTFNARAQFKAVEQMDDTFINDIEANLENQKITIEQIKDIFFIDSSVKFAETFIADEGGFKGGSLGADVESQIDNINFMLELGGITPLDAQWLLTAVLNAGAGMIGSSLRPSLENYFSTVASILMFRTGGNSIQQWHDQIIRGIDKAPTKIHIYTFGTFFVPQSYILKLTAEGLRKCANLLISEANDTGSRAHIYNPVSVSNIVRNNWSQTAKNNYKSVQIQITLLGGFLDILNQMEKIMNSLPL